MIGRGEPAREARGVAHFRLWRYATNAAMSASVSGGCIRGIRDPGFKSAASAIHRASWAESFGNIPPAIVVRLPTCVRLGPITPGDTPWIVWQARQALREYTALPRSAPLAGAGVVGPACSALAHVSNAESASTITHSPMLACDLPQNSAH